MQNKGAATDKSDLLYHLDERQKRALDLLLKQKIITTKDVALLFGLGIRAANNICNFLRKKHKKSLNLCLKQESADRILKPKQFVVIEIIDIADDPQKGLWHQCKYLKAAKEVKDDGKIVW